MRDIWLGGDDDMWKNTGASRAGDMKVQAYLKAAMAFSKEGHWYTVKKKEGQVAADFIRCSRNLVLDLYKYNI